MEEEVLKKYYSSYCTILKILTLRGYFISELYDKSFEKFSEEFSECQTLSSFKAALSQNMTFENSKNKKSSKITIFWINDRKLGANIREIVSILKNSGVNTAFVIADEGPTPQVGETIKCLKITEKINISVWSLKESMVFIPDHRLVPKHRICSPKEKKEIYARYGITNDKQPPKIRITDPMVKFIGANKGELIELIRINEYDATKKSLSYRIVF